MMRPPAPANLICSKCGNEPATVYWGTYFKKDGTKCGYWNIMKGKQCKKQTDLTITSRKIRSMRFLGDRMFDGSFKECLCCHRSLPRIKDHWSKSARGKDRLQSYCKHCCSIRYFGLQSSLEREDIREFQNNKCPMCVDRVLPPNGGAKLDHNYDILPISLNSGINRNDWQKYPKELRRKSIRGLLCHKHNGEVAAVDKYFHNPLFRLAYNSYVADPPAQHVLFPN